MPYLEDLMQRFWHYKDLRFAEHDLFEEAAPRGCRPPVYVKTAADRNVLLDPSLAPTQRRVVLGAIPSRERHRWFRSMRSSQALVQSIFGHLIATRALGVLSNVTCDLGAQPFLNCRTNCDNIQLECAITHLAEPRSTSVDVFVNNGPRFAIECKLAEEDVGCCSRPKLPATDAEYCNGSYELQQGRVVPCALTAAGVRYWEFIPKLFDWNVAQPLHACPLHRTYQLVRNILAACVDASGNLVDGVAVLVFDDRNPAWQNGNGHIAFQQVRASLQEPHRHRLQRCSWQSIMSAMREEPSLQWLTNELGIKYGL